LYCCMHGSNDAREMKGVVLPHLSVTYCMFLLSLCYRLHVTLLMCTCSVCLTMSLSQSDNRTAMCFRLLGRALHCMHRALGGGVEWCGRGSAFCAGLHVPCCQVVFVLLCHRPAVCPNAKS
jgi:hypothetical protein